MSLLLCVCKGNEWCMFLFVFFTCSNGLPFEMSVVAQWSILEQDFMFVQFYKYANSILTTFHTNAAGAPFLDVTTWDWKATNWYRQNAKWTKVCLFNIIHQMLQSSDFNPFTYEWVNLGCVLNQTGWKSSKSNYNTDSLIVYWICIIFYFFIFSERQFLSHKCLQRGLNPQPIGWWG